MDKILTSVMRECRNYFYARDSTTNMSAVFEGDFEIAGGKIALETLPLTNSYIRIIGSTLNDGVFKVLDVLNGEISVENAQDEKFTGKIAFLAVPADFLEIAEEIRAFRALESANPMAGAIKSESFAGYSYTKASGNTSGVTASWREVYASRLGIFRKQFEERI